MIPKKRTKKEKREELYILMILDGKTVDEIKREVFLLRILAIFMMLFTLGMVFIAHNFDTSKWGYYLTDGLIPTISYFSFCCLFAIYMAVSHNYKYKLLINEQ